MRRAATTWTGIGAAFAMWAAVTVASIDARGGPDQEGIVRPVPTAAVAVPAPPVALATGTEQDGATLPAPSRSLPKPPNNHLGYVITWYGLALALVYVLIAYAKRLREQEASGRRRSRSGLLREPGEDP